MVTVLNVACWVILFAIVFTLGFIIGGCFLSAMVIWFFGLDKYKAMTKAKMSKEDAVKIFKEWFNRIRIELT